MKNEDELVIQDRGFPPEQVTEKSALSLHQKNLVYAESININMESRILLILILISIGLLDAPIFIFYILVPSHLRQQHQPVT